MNNTEAIEMYNEIHDEEFEGWNAWNSWETMDDLRNVVRDALGECVDKYDIDAICDETFDYVSDIEKYVQVVSIDKFWDIAQNNALGQD